MADVLVVAEVFEGKVRKATCAAIACARQAAAALGSGYCVLALGSGLDEAAKELAGYGAAKVLVADDPSLDQYLAEKYAPTVAALAKDFAAVFGTATAFGKDLLPRVAGRLGAGYAADITRVVFEGGKLLYERPMFAGNAYGVCELVSAVHVVSVRQSAFEAAAPAGGASPIEKVAVVAPGAAAGRIAWDRFAQVKSARPELAEAKVVVSGGRGVKDKFSDLLGPLADLLGAAIGATRAACDAGNAGPELQVGQTGKIVAPELYFAVGISGAIQHVAGMKGSKVIVAINKDPEAPIFQVADYGLVADLFKAVPELVERVRAVKG
ncbi:MAG: electron transfer flavoprotein subunit alpha/FixB family protein [Deltaproteobacteria bacterium]|nr:electron transfer flavoprotein subunit alpha/FixB family protein [Deltaproteobacteria bacterium]